MAENKTLSDEIKKTSTINDMENVSVKTLKKHLQEFKEELKKHIQSNYIKSPSKMRILEELNTQMQKHFGDKLI